MITRGTTGHYHTEAEAIAACPEGAYDIAAYKVDRFHLETVRQDWPDPNPPAYPRMAADVGEDGYLEIWQASYTIDSPDVDQDEFYMGLGLR